MALDTLTHALTRLRTRILGLGPSDDLGLYASRYEALARHHDNSEAVGGGSFDLFGELELGLLQTEGLAPGDRLLDLGCGGGRLARQVVPYLVGGQYIGSDLSPTMLARARSLLAEEVGDPPCEVELLLQTRHVLPLTDASVDFVCAFSVFTHVEHEDTYHHLVDALRLTRRGGRMLLSCLPLDVPGADEIFLESASRNVRARWAVGPRNVVTHTGLVEAIARLAGWRVLRWYAGDEANIKHPKTGQLHALGQSTCVLEKP